MNKNAWPEHHNTPPMGGKGPACENAWHSWHSWHPDKISRGMCGFFSVPSECQWHCERRTEVGDQRSEIERNAEDAEKMEKEGADRVDRLG